MIKPMEGLIAAPFTPLDARGALHLPLIRDYYRFLKNNGIAGVFICGSTGEGASLTMAEKKAVARAWASATRNDDDFKVILFVGGTCIVDSQELALYAQQERLDAISFTAPYYFRPADPAALAACCQEVARVAPAMPFYYYHIPVLTAVNFSMLDLLKNVDQKIPNFAGIKYTHENFMDFLSCLHFKNGKYDMLWGRDENLLAALALGARGAVGSTYNYAAPLYLEMMTAFGRQDLERAQTLQLKSIEMIGLLEKYGGMGTGKAFMKLAGLDCGGFRLPVINMDGDQFELFRKDADSLRFQLFCCRNGEPRMPVNTRSRQKKNGKK